MTAPKPPDSNADVTAWIRSIEAGEEDAVAELWDYCHARLMKYARSKLPEHFRRALDEEDVALSAFKSFYLRAANGSFGSIDGRDSLWRLLYYITARKAHEEVRLAMRQKRGGGQVSGESAFIASGDRYNPGMEGIPDDRPAPDAKAESANYCEALFDQLEDDVLKVIALLRIEGYSVDEIAQRAGCAKRSVERRLNLIRSIWQDVAVSPGSRLGS